MKATVKHIVKKVTLELVYEVVEERTKELKEELKELKAYQQRLETKVDDNYKALNSRIDQIHTRLDQIMHVLMELRRQNTP